MKKWILFLICITMLMFFMPAMALAITIPATIDEIPNLPAKLSPPTFDFTRIEGGYAVSFGGEQPYDTVTGFVENNLMGNSTFDFTWDEVQRKYITVAPELTFDGLIFRSMDAYPPHDSDGINVNPYNGTVNAVYMGRDSSDYDWHEWYDSLLYRTTINGIEIEASYSTKTNDISFYSIRESNLTIQYDRFGRIEYVYKVIENADKTLVLSWDKQNEAWLTEMDGNTVVYSEEPPFDASAHKAPLALPYVIEVPPAYYDPAKGSLYYGSNIQAAYDRDGIILDYWFETFDEIHVSYDKYGRFLYASADVKVTASEWRTVYWFDQQNAWTYKNNGKEIVYDGLADFDKNNHPAPYAEEYKNELPPLVITDIPGVELSQFVAAKLGTVQIENGVLSIGDQNYKSLFLNYNEPNGETLYLPFEYNEQTDTWTTQGKLPEGVTFDDILLMISSGNVTTCYKEGKLAFVTIDRISKNADGTYFYDGTNRTNVDAYFDAEGNMISYIYYDYNNVFSVRYDMEGNILTYDGTSKDGKMYHYSLEDGWSVYDPNSKKYVPCEKPADHDPERDTDPLIVILGADMKNGQIVTSTKDFEQLPAINVPVLVLPDGYPNASDLALKYTIKQGTDENSLIYDIVLVDQIGQEVKLEKECMLCLPYPEAFNDDHADEYAVTIVHYGDKTETFTSKDGTITMSEQGMCIKITSFSPFDVSWEKILEEKEVPKTGDSTPLGFWLMIIALSGTMLVALKRRLA